MGGANASAQPITEPAPGSAGKRPIGTHLLPPGLARENLNTVGIRGSAEERSPVRGAGKSCGGSRRGVEEPGDREVLWNVEVNVKEKELVLGAWRVRGWRPKPASGCPHFRSPGFHLSDAEFSRLFALTAFGDRGAFLSYLSSFSPRRVFP